MEIGKGYTSVEWREDLKVILRKTAEGEQPGVFLFTDTQVKSFCFIMFHHEHVSAFVYKSTIRFVLDFLYSFYDVGDSRSY